jgi:tetratricopeptide (TPR) repeat protein
VLKYFWKVLITSIAVMAIFITPIHAIGETANELTDAKPIAGLNVQEVELQLFKLSESLLQDPHNPQLLLQKGIYLSDLGKLQAAFDIFDSLRQAFPEQPAPYTNLAAIYARWGRLEDARQMLVKSNALQANRFQTHISIASVNIGLALEALAKAREINPEDTATQTKLQALEKYVADTNKLTSHELGASHASAAQRSSARTISKAGAASITEPSKRKFSAKNVSDQLRLETIGSDVTTVAIQGEKTEDALHADVVAAVKSWTGAWIQKSQDDYLSHYSAAFQPFDGTQRDAWEQRKRTLLQKAKFIRVDLKILNIQFDGPIATVQVQQTYRSDRYSDHVRKELKLRLEQGRWKLLAEKPLAKDHLR